VILVDRFRGQKPFQPWLFALDRIILGITGMNDLLVGKAIVRGKLPAARLSRAERGSKAFIRLPFS
jgi:hypothetical protein